MQLPSSLRPRPAPYAPLDHGLKENSVLPEIYMFFSSGGGLDWEERKALGPWRNWREKKMFDSWLTNGDCSSVTWSSSLTWNPPCNWRTHLPIRQGGGSVSRYTEFGNQFWVEIYYKKHWLYYSFSRSTHQLPFLFLFFSLAACRF